MITATNVSIQFGKRILFDEVNIKFHGERCYGMIGANGAGKSTFLKVLSGEIEPNTGQVSLETGKRMAVLSQDHYKYDDVSVLNTVIMGYEKLWELIKEKEAIYAKPDFSEEDGLIAADLEIKFEEMNGWNAESDASNMLCGLGIPPEDHYKLMKDLEGSKKVRALLAQALFGNPDVLILDEPTNHLDLRTIEWLEDFLLSFKNTVIVVSHDRHFLDTVCTNIADIDFKIQPRVLIMVDKEPYFVVLASVVKVTDVLVAVITNYQKNISCNRHRAAELLVGDVEGNVIVDTVHINSSANVALRSVPKFCVHSVDLVGEVARVE